jgi:hypothetical protein
MPSHEKSKGQHCPKGVVRDVVLSILFGCKVLFNIACYWLNDRAVIAKWTA